MIKNTYKNDYAFTPRLSKRGRVVDDLNYVGDYYVLPMDEQQKKKSNRINLMFALMILTVHILGGLMNQDSSRTAWVVFPYIITFLPIAYLIMGVIISWNLPLRLHKAQFETGIERMKRSSVGCFIFTILNTLLDIIYIIRNVGTMDLIKELLYLFLHIVMLFVLFRFIKFYNRTYGNVAIESN